VKHIFTIPVILALFLIVAGSGCIDENTNYTDVGKTYTVTELHLGHANGETFEIVVYKDGDTIQTLTNNNRERGSGYQVQLNMHSTDSNESTLVYVKTLGDNYDESRPRDVYDLYVSPNMHFSGVDSTYEVHAGKSTREETATVS
jgi:hypothetical protein